MKKILFYQPDFLQGNFFSLEHEYKILDPFIVLKRKLAKIGYEAQTIDESPLVEAEKIVFIDYRSVFTDLYPGIQKKPRLLYDQLRGKKRTRRNYYSEAIKLGLRKKLVLLMLESRSVSPLNYSPKLLASFDQILTWDDDLVDNKKFFKLIPPYYRHPEPPLLVPFKGKKLLTSMTQNKTSSFPGELYTARKNSIRYFDTNFPNDFVMYGGRWHKPKGLLQKLFPQTIERFNTYQGVPMDKMGKLSKYKFTLCYENATGIKGYITEKIFDCFWAGTVPIYWGATNVTDYIDKNAFVDRRGFESDAALGRFIAGVNEVEYNRYTQAIKSYLKSRQFQKFQPDAFAADFIKNLGLKK